LSFDVKTPTLTLGKASEIVQTTCQGGERNRASSYIVHQRKDHKTVILHSVRSCPVMWVIDTTARRVLWLRMGETGPRYAGYLRI